MIKCSLIEVTTDNRAVVIVGNEVKTTPRLKWIDYVARQFLAGECHYRFN